MSVSPKPGACRAGSSSRTRCSPSQDRGHPHDQQPHRKHELTDPRHAAPARRPESGTSDQGRVPVAPPAHHLPRKPRMARQACRHRRTARPVVRERMAERSPDLARPDRHAAAIRHRHRTERPPQEHTVAGQQLIKEDTHFGV